MSRDPLIDMAEQARLFDRFSAYSEDYRSRLERFAALVAEREREECAKLCDGISARYRLTENVSRVDQCADAIRARGEK